MSYLYRYENKGIQSWLLDAGRLRDLEGGSAFIDAIAEDAKAACKPLKAEVIQAAAGGMTAVFRDRASLEEFASTWPAKLYYRMPDLPVVQAWVEFAGEPGKETFDELYAKLHARRNRVWPALPEAAPVIARASRTGRPAVRVPRHLARGNRELLVDAATARRQEARQEGRTDSFEAAGASLQLCSDGERWRLDGDVGTVAVLHADATGVGQRITEMANSGLSLQGLKDFSEALSAAMEKAVAAGLQALQRNGDGIVNANLVVLGGDDVTLLLPAQRSMCFVRALVSSFETSTQQSAARLGGKGLSLGVGICFVHPHHPFHRAYELAEADCATAKRDVRASANGHQGTPQSGLRFRRVTTSLEETEDGTGHSWDSASISNLEELVKKAGKLPRGALRTFLTPVEAGSKREAQQLWDRIAEVQRDERKQAWEHFQEALEACGADPKTGLFRAPAAQAEETDGEPAPLRSPLFDALTLDHLDAYGLRDEARRNGRSTLIDD